MAYGYSSDKVSGSRTFGLNTGRITNINWDINDNGVESINFEITIDGDSNPIRYKKFPVNKVYSNNVELNPSDPAYATELEKQTKELTGVLTHFFKVFVDEAEIEEAFEEKVETFAEYCKILMNLLPKDYDKKPVDVFLQYQWNIASGKEKTYLEVPKNLKHGPFISSHIKPVGKWKKDTSNNALKYVDTEGNVHPFVRKEWFMKSHFAEVQHNSFAKPATPSAPEFVADPWSE